MLNNRRISITKEKIEKVVLALREMQKSINKEPHLQVIEVLKALVVEEIVEVGVLVLVILHKIIQNQIKLLQFLVYLLTLLKVKLKILLEDLEI